MTVDLFLKFRPECLVDPSAAEIYVVWVNFDLGRFPIEGLHHCGNVKNCAFLRRRDRSEGMEAHSEIEGAIRYWWMSHVILYPFRSKFPSTQRTLYTFLACFSGEKKDFNPGTVFFLAHGVLPEFVGTARIYVRGEVDMGYRITWQLPVLQKTVKGAGEIRTKTTSGLKLGLITISPGVVARGEEAICSLVHSCKPEPIESHMKHNNRCWRIRSCYSCSFASSLLIDLLHEILAEILLIKCLVKYDMAYWIWEIYMYWIVENSKNFKWHTSLNDAAFVAG